MESRDTVVCVQRAHPKKEKIRAHTKHHAEGLPVARRADERIDLPSYGDERQVRPAGKDRGDGRVMRSHGCSNAFGKGTGSCQVSQTCVDKEELTGSHHRSHLFPQSELPVGELLSSLKCGT